MSDWETEVKATTVRRTGDENSIYRIVVEVERTRRGYNSYSRVPFDLAYTTNDEGRAALKSVDPTGHNAPDVTHLHHLGAVLPAVERAVEQVPDVEYVEPAEDTLSRLRPGGVEVEVCDE